MMTISLIEKLTSKEDYITFSDWLKRDEYSQDIQEDIERTSHPLCYAQIQKACNKKFNEYNEAFGCSQRFRNFFAEQKYITKKEQMNLLRSISYYPKDGKQTSHVPMFAILITNVEEKIVLIKRMKSCVEETIALMS